MTTVTRIYRFEAAHRLPEGFGKASGLHGHSYTVRVELEGGYPTETLDRFWAGLSSTFDHKLLNDVFDDTTVEGLAESLLVRLGSACPVLAVEVQEGDLRFGRATR